MTTENTTQAATKTYDEIIALLQSNHFYPAKVITNDKITELRVDCPALILMDSKKLRLEQILEGCQVKVSPMKNEGYLLIKKIK